MMARAQDTIHIQWVRSGIGFPRRQKERVRSLGLRRLHQVVERPDTPQIRGLVASIPHLVRIVEAPVSPAWASVPEYTLLPAEAAPAEKLQPARHRPVEKEEVPEQAAAESRGRAVPAEQKAAHEKREAAPASATKAGKARKAAARKQRPAKAAESKKTEAGAAKTQAPKKGKK